MRNKKGQNITEFVIILAVISVVGIIAYTMLGSQINQLFSGQEKKVKDYKPFGVAFNSDGSKIATKGGDLGGTPEKPVKKCDGNICTIDYGDFLLEGVPSNLDDYIQASGSSGGLDKLGDLVVQLSLLGNDPNSNICQSNPTLCSEDLKHFADLLKYHASLTQFIEKPVRDGVSDDDLYNYFFTNSNRLSDFGYAIPSEYTTLAPEFDQALNVYHIATSMYYNNIGYNRYLKDANGSYDISPAGAIVKQYDKIMASSDISDSAKEMIDRIYSSASNITNYSAASMNATSQKSNKGSLHDLPSWDAKTGAQGFIQFVEGDRDNILKPTITTDFNIEEALK